MSSEGPNLALEALRKQQREDAIITNHARLEAKLGPLPPFCVYQVNPAQKHNLFPTLKINSRPDQWYPWNPEARQTPCRNHIYKHLDDFGSWTSKKQTSSSPQTSAQEPGWFYQEIPEFVASLIDEDFCNFHRRTSEEIKNRARMLAADKQKKAFDETLKSK